MRVALFHDEVGPDAAPDERDVLVQMDAIGAALAEIGHECVRVPCTLNLGAASDSLRGLRPDVVFNLVESVGRQGRLAPLAPQLLEAIGMRFTGCPSAPTFITSCKPLAKGVLAAAGIGTPRWYSMEHLQEGGAVVPGRYILKSSWEHASRGLDDDSIVEVESAAGLRVQLERRRPQLAHEGFAEAFIEGREFNLSLLCGEVLPPAEIVFEGYAPGKPRIVGYAAKWAEGSAEFVGTPRRFEFPPEDGPLLSRLRGIAERCWRAFGLRGYARVDFRVDGAGEPWVLEINSNPCLSPDAGFAAAVRRAGLAYSQAIERVLNEATVP